MNKFIKLLLPFFLLIFLSCQIKKKDNETVVEKDSFPTLIAIDHVPIVVNDLEKIKSLLVDSFNFKIKEGNRHLGINNFFLKFKDGTYLEFIKPIDSTESMGQYYKNLLNQRIGGTAVAISISSSDSVKKKLDDNRINYSIDSNKIWKTIIPKSNNLFYIEYADKNWKDNVKYTSHPNNALSLQSVWFISQNINADLKEFTEFGFQLKEDTNIQNRIWKQLSTKWNSLFLTDNQNTKSITENFINRKLTGISGFTIKVNSLSDLNKKILKKAPLVINKNQTLCFLKEYNFFIQFVE